MDRAGAKDRSFRDGGRGSKSGRAVCVFKSRSDSERGAASLSTRAAIHRPELENTADTSAPFGIGGSFRGLPLATSVKASSGAPSWLTLVTKTFPFLENLAP